MFLFLLKLLFFVFFLFQRNNVLTGIAVFGEKEVLSPAYTLLDRTFDTCMLIPFSFFLLSIKCYIYAVLIMVALCNRADHYIFAL